MAGDDWIHDGAPSVRCLHGDVLERLRELPDASCNLVLTDPPYNIGHAYTHNSKRVAAAWDKVDDYVPWCISWLQECQRVLTPNGVLYMWHNDIAQIAQLMEAIREETGLALMGMCIWDKGNTYSAKTWRQRDQDSATALRSWFSLCEYCLHFFSAQKDADKNWKHTGLDRINSNPACYKPIKDWYAAELKRLGLTPKDIARKYTEATGRKPYMLRHYWQDSQFEIPTPEVWRLVYEPLGFDWRGGDYEALRKEYEALRKEYEALRNYHRCDADHCNIWHVPPVPSTGRLHTCQKPVSILRRLVRVSCPPGGTVLDCFQGSASTGVAALNEGRSYIGIERDDHYHEVAVRRLREHMAQQRMDI